MRTDEWEAGEARAMAAAAKGAPAAVTAEIIETTPLTDEQRERITELLVGGDADEG
jgi:hypothetical protein